MENVILIILLILALALIGVVLMQRSEGGGLGIGGGGPVSGRSAATALGKVTWILGSVFMAISLAMTILAARNASNSSVIDQLGTDVPAIEDDAPLLPPMQDSLPPEGADAPITPPRAN